MNAKGVLNQITLGGFVFALMLCFSCGDNEKDGKTVLTHQQMVKALTEIYLAEQKVNRLGAPRDSAAREFDRFKQTVFEKLEISDSVFKRSFDYYMDRPKEMERIFSALVDSLSLKEQRIESSDK
ncbi:MAG TPA: DUF4296 domain-containing protein [Chryseolinea sp.]|jgi:hypothetical protein|nr:DUF4296 domain-containing protein [Chryseolinea sp.]